MPNALISKYKTYKCLIAFVALSVNNNMIHKNGLAADKSIGN